MKIILLICLVVLVWLLFFEINVPNNNDWDPKAFIVEKPEGVPLDLGRGSGYDVQWHYAIVRVPFVAASYLDVPTYHNHGVFFPILMRFISFGQNDLIHWVMLMVNLGSVIVCTGILAALLAKCEVSPWWSLILPFSIGYLLSIRLDLLVPLTLSLAISGWLAYEIDGKVFAILLFALSGLTKVIGLVFPIALGVYLIGKRLWREAITLLLGSLTPYFIWGLLLTSILGMSEKGVSQSTPSLIPFGGLIGLNDLPLLIIISLWVVLPALIAGSFAAYDLRVYLTNKLNKETILVISQLVFIDFTPRLTCVDHIAVLRVG